MSRTTAISSRTLPRESPRFIALIRWDLLTTPGDYSKFLEKRAEFLRAQQKEQQTLANSSKRRSSGCGAAPKPAPPNRKPASTTLLRCKPNWRTSNERSRGGATTIDFTASGRQTKRLVTVENISKSMGGTCSFHNLKFALGPNMTLGILGSNGSGKSTLLRIIAGEIEPDHGEVRRAENLRVVWFEQNRDSIDPDLSLRRALAPEGDSIMFRDRPIHVNGWAARFLFRQEQLELPLHRLSGGERARVHIARLMLQPADLLLLDEPTNDLDIPTLEVLEANLADFPGAIVLVTHDRFLLDRLSTTLLAMDGKGGVEFFAELSQWKPAESESKPKEGKTKGASAPSQKKLSYMEAREWEQIEQRVEEAEAVLDSKRNLLEQPDVVSDPTRLTAALAELDAAQTETDRLYARWAELEARQK